MVSRPVPGWSNASGMVVVDEGANPMARGIPCWKNWYARLEARLLAEGRTEETCDINDEFRNDVGTDEPLARMQQPGFWRATQPGGHPDWGMAWRSRFEVVFSPDADGVVRQVTFRLI
jgi:hypothetical protein